MSRPRGLTGISMAVMVSASLLLVSGCGASSTTPPTLPSTSPASTAPITAAPTTAAAPTTTVYSPTAAQPSPDAAVAALVQDWGAGKRAAAAAVANPAAVAGLFAQPYPSGYLQDRGCTAASVNPGNCDYRNTDSDSLYEFGVSQGTSGWYVSSFTFED